MPLGSHSTSFEKWAEVLPEDAKKWASASPYFQTPRSIIPMSDLPGDDTQMDDEILQTVNSISSRSNAMVRMGADEGVADAESDCGLDRKSTRLNSSHGGISRMPSSA